MWVHKCPIEKSLMMVGKGEECNWCGKKEPTQLPLAGKEKTMNDRNINQGLAPPAANC